MHVTVTRVSYISIVSRLDYIHKLSFIRLKQCLIILNFSHGRFLILQMYDYIGTWKKYFISCAQKHVIVKNPVLQVSFVEVSLYKRI